MRNGAYTLAFIAVLGGLVLLMIGRSGSIETSLGTVLLIVALLLGGVGKIVDLLGYVGEGAAEPDE
jgi:hypothetical protein